MTHYIAIRPGFGSSSHLEFDAWTSTRTHSDLVTPPCFTIQATFISSYDRTEPSCLLSHTQLNGSRFHAGSSSPVIHVCGPIPSVTPWDNPLLTLSYLRVTLIRKGFLGAFLYGRGDDPLSTLFAPPTVDINSIRPKLACQIVPIFFSGP